MLSLQVYHTSVPCLIAGGLFRNVACRYYRLGQYGSRLTSDAPCQFLHSESSESQAGRTIGPMGFLGNRMTIINNQHFLSLVFIPCQVVAELFRGKSAGKVLIKIFFPNEKVPSFLLQLLGWFFL